MCFLNVIADDRPECGVESERSSTPPHLAPRHEPLTLGFGCVWGHCSPCVLQHGMEEHATPHLLGRADLHRAPAVGTRQVQWKFDSLDARSSRRRRLRACLRRLLKKDFAACLRGRKGGLVDGWTSLRRRLQSGPRDSTAGRHTHKQCLSSRQLQRHPPTAITQAIEFRVSVGRGLGVDHHADLGTRNAKEDIWCG